METNNLEIVGGKYITNGIQLTQDLWITYYKELSVASEDLHQVCFLNPATFSEDYFTLVQYSRGIKTLIEYEDTKGIMPVILIDKRIEITAGDGSFSAPYVYEFDY